NKAYAPKARTDCIKPVTERAPRFGIHSYNLIDPIEFKGDLAVIENQAFSKKGGELREKLAGRVKHLGFEMFIRSSAYTWFNRFVAIRYMELHDFLGHGFRVLSNPNGSDIPEILEHATDVDLPGLNKEKVIELRLAGDKDNELYRMLIIAQCNALNKAMPFLFEKIDNEAELLLPDNLLHSNSPVRKMVQDIHEDLWKDVEIIGWVYQFYISEKKDEVIGKVVKSEDIPAATQLFTPNWIVKYMVQNTLGRMWMATYPHSALKDRMEYYIEPAEQDPEVQKEIDAATPKELSPEALTFLDPACGSGHILVEAYDILKEIYLERGYRTRDIPRLILEKNLYGLDIDDRAAQLACFAVLMCARKDDRRLFSRDSLALNIMSIVETKGFDKDKLLNAVSKRDGGKGVWVWIDELVESFEQAKTFGSLIIIPDEMAGQLNEIKSVIESDIGGSDDIFNYAAGKELENLMPILNQTYILTKKYDCVVANPPYMGAKGMNSMLKDFAKIHFPGSKSDLFSTFVERIMKMVLKDRHIGIMTPFTWMFLSSYERLREKIVTQKTLTSLIRPEYHAFFESAYVPICSFTILSSKLSGFKSIFIDLKKFYGSKVQAPKTLEAIQNPSCSWRYLASTINFKKIPGSPIAYWVSDNTFKAYEKFPSLKELYSFKRGIATGDNDLFLRIWQEIDFEKVEQKWFPYNKGGDFRKWYGNKEYFVDWEDDGYVLQNFKDKNGRLRSRPQNIRDNFKENISYSSLTSGMASFRYFEGFINDQAGNYIVSKKNKKVLCLLPFLNSKVANQLIQIKNQTLNITADDINSIPIALIEECESLGVDCCMLAKTDWDSYEKSWDFTALPLMQFDCRHSTLKDSYTKLCVYLQKMTLKMQRLEDEINRIFIEAYGLKSELSADVPLNEITLNCNPQYRYTKGKTEEEYNVLLLVDTIKELISYAIGCMVGRYSLDHSGLIYSHSGNIDFDSSKYKTFPADDDGIIPSMDMDWFEDDAARRFVEFIKTAWPPEYLNENLKFIADALNPKTNESSEETIRRYLSALFFKDHMKTYKKRPIYWLFSSGKQKAFECLVYLHRYNDATLSRMRSHYVTPLQGNIRARIEFLEHEKDEATTASNQKKIQKEIDILKKKQVELKIFDDELRHYADMKISIDLDDGVKVNYGKFGNLLAETKTITGKK
ncbi:MAG: BREX-1 system adenine-specific DNA-methyltransferase PglX, partial [Desulfobacula sp.]|nr:BREX-1 system adenine-specific DNA-methyltransferase PglX [Desulfobacula sp.]